MDSAPHLPPCWLPQKKASWPAGGGSSRSGSQWRPVPLRPRSRSLSGPPCWDWAHLPWQGLASWPQGLPPPKPAPPWAFGPGAEAVRTGSQQGTESESGTQATRPRLPSTLSMAWLEVGRPGRRPWGQKPPNQKGNSGALCQKTPELHIGQGSSFSAPASPPCALRPQPADPKPIPRGIGRSGQLGNGLGHTGPSVPEPRRQKPALSRALCPPVLVPEQLFSSDPTARRAQSDRCLDANKMSVSSFLWL